MDNEPEFKTTVKALIRTYSPRPQCWFNLVAVLINEGFTFDHMTAEWSKVDDTPCKVDGCEQQHMIYGHISFTETRAWLRHRDNTQSHHVYGVPSEAWAKRGEVAFEEGRGEVPIER